MEVQTDEQIYIKLYDMYEKSEDRIKSDAMVSRAYIDKISSESITKKVDNQLSSIKYAISQINSRFNENSKNYTSTKEQITETLANYEQVLRELSEFYDGKIEQLILRRVELEASLIGSILNDQYLFDKILKKNDQKESDKTQLSIKENIKIAIEKIKSRKNNKSQIDIMDVSKLMDSQDIAREIEEKNSLRVERTIEDRKENRDFISKTEKEISLVSKEIERLNKQKESAIFDAMESGEKAVSNNIRKPKLFNKITQQD